MEVDQTVKETTTKTNMADEAVKSPTVENVLSPTNASEEKESIPATENGSKQDEAAKDVTVDTKIDEKETPNTAIAEEAKPSA